ncbi:hypothetical protein ICV35_00120 [Rhodococcus ruber]|uniref:hypothetical protein n=1 Tax=Rhodococcus TaxID=1827 RepID=UPI000C7E1B4C|nr:MULTISPECIES: hypothetical protein [Rhodococcus]AUM16688.1 hypothetical protein CSW53_09175 [Rhodococcus ruber]MBD8052070.1 hypothetical protein [Rhodococcus ruber]
MTPTSTRPRSPVAARRFGYLVAALLNAVVLYAANVWPGWEAVPFLTDDTRSVIGWVNASILVSLVANLLYLMRDPVWFKALGDAVTTTVALLALLTIWQVFPFDFGDASFDWPLVARIVLGLGIVSSVIGIVAALVTFVRSVVGRSSARGTRSR